MWLSSVVVFEFNTQNAPRKMEREATADSAAMILHLYAEVKTAARDQGSGTRDQKGNFPKECP